MGTVAIIGGEPGERMAFEAAREVCRRHARSFYFASFFLPKHKRYAAYAVYAFCRMVDDAIDVEEDRSAALVSEAGACGCGTSALDGRIEMFRERLEEIYAGALPPPGEGTQMEL